MLAEPSGRRVGRTPRGMLARRRELPDIPQDMGHPATGVIEGFGGSLATGHLLFRPFHQRQMQLREVGHLRRPMIHLQIDVQVIVSIPRRMDRVAPESLQVGRQQADTRRGDQQVATELEVKRHQRGILTIRREGGQPLVDRPIVALRSPQLQSDPIEQRLISLYMLPAQRRIILTLRIRQLAVERSLKPIRLPIIGRQAHQQNSFRSVPHRERRV